MKIEVAVKVKVAIWRNLSQVEEGLLERAIWHLAESLHPHHFLLSQVIIYIRNFKLLCNKTDSAAQSRGNLHKPERKGNIIFWQNLVESLFVKHMIFCAGEGEACTAYKIFTSPKPWSAHTWENHPGALHFCSHLHPTTKWRSPPPLYVSQNIRTAIFWDWKELLHLFFYHPATASIFYHPALIRIFANCSLAKNLFISPPALTHPSRQLCQESSRYQNHLDWHDLLYWKVLIPAWSRLTEADSGMGRISVQQVMMMIMIMRMINNQLLIMTIWMMAKT